jgi:mono/diheme cytochrome c family protein
VLALLALLPVAPSAGAADPPPPAEAAIGERPPDTLVSPDSLTDGRHTFFVYCSNCHGTDGWGGPCPNLADEVTLHGGRYADMLATITRGVEGTEMPRWFGKLEFDRIMQVAAYVYSLKGTRVPRTVEGQQVSARRRATLYMPPPPGEAAKPPAAPH